MSKLGWLVVIGGMLCSLVTPTLAQNAQTHEALTTTLVTQIKTVLNADSVLGKPLDFQGTKIIPIVSIAFGFGSGSEVSEEADKQEDTGTGGGGGGLVSPQGLLIITKDGEVKVLPASKGAISEVIQGLAPVLLEAVKTRQGPEKKDEPKGPPTTKP